MKRKKPGASGMHAAGDLPVALRPTRPQLAAWAIASVLALTAGMLWSAYTTNLKLSARDVGGAVMPPGMIMTRDLPGAAMRDMAAVDPNSVSYRASPNAQGDQELFPRLDGGVKVFDLEVSVIEWWILPDRPVLAYAFNHQVPGPRIELHQGDRVRINVTNHLPESTTVHWHGLVLPNIMDGPADVTQAPIRPGATFTYAFDVTQVGTFFYHSHDNPDRQQALGEYGALIIAPADPSVDGAYDYNYDMPIQLQEWLVREGWTFPAMLMDGALPNYFTINGKSYPATPTIVMRVGEKARFRFIGSNNNFVHPMHIHGGPFTIIATDGNPVPVVARLQKDTVDVGPGERYDVIWEARQPGKWLLHCHIPHHTTNDNGEEDGGGGLMMIIDVLP
ncbi:MAG: multicopper oxidase family protein [Candidatus Dormibacteraceae bacterium]